MRIFRSSYRLTNTRSTSKSLSHFHTVMPSKAADLESIKQYLAEKHQGDNHPVFKVALTSEALLTNPRWNKGTAFTTEEREAFDLVGKLPLRVNTLDEQSARAWDQYKTRHDNLARNTFLQSLKTQNWVLYYSLLGRNLKDVLPVVYTPTVRRSNTSPEVAFRSNHHYSAAILGGAFRFLQNKLLC